jgi:antitoxin PrlF
MDNSKLTSKFQATIPQEIRSILKLHRGDRIIFEVTKTNRVEIRKATPMDLIYLKSIESTLNEWNSKNDEEDFCDL